jgi:hypothetical protein
VCSVGVALCGSNTEYISVAEPRGWVQRSAGAVEGYLLHRADSTGMNGIES